MYRNTWRYPNVQYIRDDYDDYEDASEDYSDDDDDEEEEEDQFTVHSLLELVGERRTFFHTRRPGFTEDHVVELQLVVEALNRIPRGNQYSVNNLDTLVKFFNARHNMQAIPHEQNEAKGRAVNTLIHGGSRDRQFNHWMTCVQAKWSRLRDRLDGFTGFKQKMDEILDEI